MSGNHDGQTSGIHRRRIAVAVTAAVILLAAGILLLFPKLFRPAALPDAEPALTAEEAAGTTKSSAPKTMPEETDALRYRLNYYELICYDGDELVYEKNLEPFQIQYCLEQEDGVLLCGHLNALSYQGQMTQVLGYFEYKGRHWDYTDFPAVGFSRQLEIPWMIRLDERGEILWEKEIVPETEQQEARFAVFGLLPAENGGFAVFCEMLPWAGGAYTLYGQQMICQFYAPDGTLRREEAVPAEAGRLETVFFYQEEYLVLLQDSVPVQLMRLDRDGRFLSADTVPAGLFPEQEYYLSSCILLWNGKIWLSGSCHRDRTDSDPADLTKAVQAVNSAWLSVYDLESRQWSVLSSQKGSVGAQLYPESEDVLIWEKNRILKVTPEPMANAYDASVNMDFVQSRFDRDGKCLSEKETGLQYQTTELSGLTFGARYPSSYYDLEAKPQQQQP